MSGRECADGGAASWCVAGFLVWEGENLLLECGSLGLPPRLVFECRQAYESLNVFDIAEIDVWKYLSDTVVVNTGRTGRRHKERLAKKKKYAPSGVWNARGVSSGAGTTSNGGREGSTYRVAVPAFFPQDSAPVPGASLFPRVKRDCRTWGRPEERHHL